MTTTRKPRIVVSETDHDRLTRLAEAGLDWEIGVADELQAEMARTRIVPAGRVPADAVRMGSTVEFTSDAGHHMRVTLVYPAEADIDHGRISVLTPIGAALIGLSVGQSIAWTARGGTRHELTVTGVIQPE